MVGFASARLTRDQLVLFPQRLDEAIAADAPVRVLDEILEQLDWSAWEQHYHLRHGQPPIHPRTLAAIVLQGILCGIHSSRRLEEACHVRLDFRWLACALTPDHTTISKFRTAHAVALRQLFVQIGRIASGLGYLSFQRLGFDGTRLRANNRKSGTRTAAEIAALAEQLEQQFDAAQAQAKEQDAQQQQQLLEPEPSGAAEALASQEQRRRSVAEALAELKRLEAGEFGGSVPARLPIVDPHSRVMPNKQGGFAPNYTPTALVDIDSGFIVAADVLSTCSEEHAMLPAVDEAIADFELAGPPRELLADGNMFGGENIAACESRGIDLLCPPPGEARAALVAQRDELNKPVAAELIDQLPTREVTAKGQKREVFDKAAFVYDEENKCFWCPQGQRLDYGNTHTPKGQAPRHRFWASQESCAACPLRERCLSSDDKKRRQIDCGDHEAAIQRHTAKMAQPESQSRYSDRRTAGERPFALIKRHFGVQQFAHRTRPKVRQEWFWLVTAHNIKLLLGLLRRSGAGPPLAAATG